MTADLNNLPPVRMFGYWDAPVTDDAEEIDVPTELKCMHCDEHFAEGDNGAIMPTGFAAHRECSVRLAFGGIGHLVDHNRYCMGELGTDAGLSIRDSSLLVWLYTVERHKITPDDLETLRKGKRQVYEHKDTTETFWERMRMLHGPDVGPPR